MDLGDWRSRINDLDNQILNLLNQRAEAALRIGDLKRRREAPAYVPEREAAILRRLAEVNAGPLSADAVTAVWREILSVCRALEGGLTVAYLGPQATFTHQAALARFGSTAELRPVRTIADIFDEVERGRAHFGVVPVENSTEGAVNVTLDRLVDAVSSCGTSGRCSASQIRHWPSPWGCDSTRLTSARSVARESRCWARDRKSVV